MRANLRPRSAMTALLTSDCARAAALLRQGGLVAFPTETVYGLGADARNAAAVARVFAAKGRPADHPLIVHLADVGELEEWAVEVPPEAWRLAEAFWPGPLTLVLKRAPGVLDCVTGGQPTVGVRVPSHPVAQRLLRLFGGGVAAPSANRFGRVSPTSATHVESELGEELRRMTPGGLVLEGGACEVGLESTIVDCSGATPAILRPGGVTREQIEALLATPTPERATSEVRTPGQLPSHYAPRARVELTEASEVPARAETLRAQGRRVGVLAMEPFAVPVGVEMLAWAAEPEVAARELYARLREADERGLDVLLTVLPPEVGVGRAICDRLRRAAAARPDESS